MDPASDAAQLDTKSVRHAARLIAQHAETSRLLGVDFVAVYRRGGGAVGGGDGGDTAGSVAEHPGERSVQAGSVGAAVVGGQPAGGGARSGAYDGSGRQDGEDSGGGEAEGTAGGGVPEAVPVVLDEIAPDGRVRREVQAELDSIRVRYEADAPHTQFVTAHTRIVFGEGDPCARLMFIGEAPGADEDRTGRPFVGRAGQLLDKMIAAMGLRRADVYIANVLKTRPPNNATPTMEEARLCAPYLFDQVGAVKPRVIVSLGLPATRTLLNTEESMSRLRGTAATFSWKGLTVPVMPTYHPAYVLRSYTKDVRQKVWSDLQKAMEIVRGGVS